MPRLAEDAIIRTMNRRSKPTRLLLVADPRPAAADPANLPVRRYRLARLRLNGRSQNPALRFEHLKRVFD